MDLYVLIQRKGVTSQTKEPLIPSNFPEASYGRLTISGTYFQTSEGYLQIFFDSKQTSSLSISGDAHLAGELVLWAKKEFYPEGWISPEPFLSAFKITGDFETIGTNSPTMEFTTFRSSHEAYQTYHVQKPDKKRSEETSSSAEKQSQTISTQIQAPNSGSENSTHVENQIPSPPISLNEDPHASYESGGASFESARFLTSPQTLIADHLTDVSHSEREALGYTTGVDEIEDASLTISGLTRPWNAYSRYAADDNSFSVGLLLRRLVRRAAGDPALETLYTALDFSALDGSEIRTALAQMTPTSYSAVYGASLSRQQQAYDLLNTLPSPASGTSSPWQVFAIPFGERGSQNSEKDLRIPHKGSERGVMFGAEHRTSQTSPWLWGIHGLVTQGDLSISAQDAAQNKATGSDVGLHLRYGTSLNRGLFFTAQARVGIQSNTLKRQLTIGSYGGPLSAEWSSWSTAASLFGGYLIPLMDKLSFGPVAGLDHTSVSFPTLTESSILPTALTLNANTFAAAQGRLGLKGRVDFTLKCALEALATWDQELLTQTLTQEAQFAAYSTALLAAENPVIGPQTLTLQAQFVYKVTPNLTLAARGSKTLRSGANISLGQISGTWRF